MVKLRVTLGTPAHGGVGRLAVRVYTPPPRAPATATIITRAILFCSMSYPNRRTERLPHRVESSLIGLRKYLHERSRQAKFRSIFDSLELFRHQFSERVCSSYICQDRFEGPRRGYQSQVNKHWPDGRVAPSTRALHSRPEHGRASNSLDVLGSAGVLSRGAGLRGFESHPPHQSLKVPSSHSMLGA